jgi:signal peptidase I
VNWHSRWQPWPAADSARLCKDDSQGFDVEGKGDLAGWMRYRNVAPTENTWRRIQQGEKSVQPEPELANGRLISDFYAYNSYNTEYGRQSPNGLHWVGDIALECDVDVKSSSGELFLDIVEAGIHYQIAIDVATGTATALVSDPKYAFHGGDADNPKNPTASTTIRGPGRHQLRLSNLDNELVLWVDEKVVTFDRPLTFDTDPENRPVSSAEDPGDLAPAGIGAKGSQIHVRQARILRDVYYVATSDSYSMPTDYEGVEYFYDANNPNRLPDLVWRTLDDPAQWASTRMLQARRFKEFDLDKDQFFPMGDNSQHFVQRDLLTGKAVLVYWPHALPRPIPVIPNIMRMRLIR